MSPSAFINQTSGINCYESQLANAFYIQVFNCQVLHDKHSNIQQVITLLFSASLDTNPYPRPQVTAT